MKISIIKIEVETVEWGSLDMGSLFTDPELDDSPLYIKTNEGNSVNLLTGQVEDKLRPNHKVIDDTDNFVIVNL